MDWVVIDLAKGEIEWIVVEIELVKGEIEWIEVVIVV
jgi:hypothetical protein